MKCVEYGHCRSEYSRLKKVSEDFRYFLCFLKSVRLFESSCRRVRRGVNLPTDSYDLFHNIITSTTVLSPSQKQMQINYFKNLVRLTSMVHFSRCQKILHCQTPSFFAHSGCILLPLEVHLSLSLSPPSQAWTLSWVGFTKFIFAPKTRNNRKNDSVIARAFLS